MAGAKKADLSEWAWGKQTILEILRTRPAQILEIVMASPDQDPLRKEIFDLCGGLKIPVTLKARRQIDALCPVPAHQAVIARLKAEVPYWSLEDLLEGLEATPGRIPFLLALDHIQDPQNLGAIIRTACCAGAAGIILPRDRACPVSGTVRKAAAGAVEHLPLIQVVNLVRTLDTLKEKGFWILSLEADSPLTVYDLDLRVPLVVVIGGES
jgi:23S rRNA (guanosine2251-2'-O)-methyltransferase